MLEPLLYNKKTKEGVMITSENIIKQGELIYNILAIQKKEPTK